jgi:hypothetical protein
MLAELLAREDIELAELVPRQIEVLTEFLNLCGSWSSQFYMACGDHCQVGDMSVSVSLSQGWFVMEVRRTGAFWFSLRDRDRALNSGSMSLSECAREVLRLMEAA